MSGIQYLSGDATAPIGRRPCIIAHICNDTGDWGKGFVLSISKRWPQVEASYRQWHKGVAGKPFALGEVDFVPTGDGGIVVANMIAQHGLRSADNLKPLCTGSLKLCLAAVRHTARELGAGVHMPRIGTNLAGGSWEEIEPIINFELVDKGIPVFVYTLPPRAEAV